MGGEWRVWTDLCRTGCSPARSPRQRRRSRWPAWSGPGGAGTPARLVPPGGELEEVRGGQALCARTWQTPSRRACAARPTDGQSTDRVDVLVGKRRTARSPVRITPTLPDDLALPCEHCRRGHDQGRPQAAGKEPTGKARNARSAQVNRGRESLQDLDLAAEHDDLDVFLEPAESMNSQKIEGAPDETEGEQEGHDPRGCRGRRASWSQTSSRSTTSARIEA